MRDAALDTLYARFASRWHGDITRLGYPAAYAQLTRALQPEPAAVVLDVGTGTGALVQTWLADNPTYEQLILLDKSKDMLAEAQTNLAQHENVDFRAADLTQHGLPPASIDLLLSAHVIEHLEDAQAALSQFASLLRPGGQVALSISKPHWCTALVRWRWGHKAFAPPTVHTMLTKAGFGDIRTVRFAKGPPSRTSCGYIARRA